MHAQICWPVLTLQHTSDIRLEESEDGRTCICLCQGQPREDLDPSDLPATAEAAAEDAHTHTGMILLHNGWGTCRGDSFSKGKVQSCSRRCQDESSAWAGKLHPSDAFFPNTHSKKCALKFGNESACEASSWDQQNFVEPAAGLNVLRKPVGVCLCVLEVPSRGAKSRSAPPKLRLPWEQSRLASWPGILTLLTSFPLAQKAGRGPNPSLEYISWEEVVLHAQTSDFITRLVIRKHWETLTIRVASLCPTLSAPTRMNQCSSLQGLPALDISVQIVLGMVCSTEAFKKDRKWGQHCDTVG